MPWKDPVRTPTTEIVTLKTGQYTPIPKTDNKIVLLGPGTIAITKHINGDVTGQVKTGNTGTLFDAVHNKLQRVGW